jgi:hypothetical protein
VVPHSDLKCLPAERFALGAAMILARFSRSASASALTARMIAPVVELPLPDSDWEAREWRLAAMMAMVISIG